MPERARMSLHKLDQLYLRCLEAAQFELCKVRPERIILNQVGQSGWVSRSAPCIGFIKTKFQAF